MRLRLLLVPALLSLVGSCTPPPPPVTPSHPLRCDPTIRAALGEVSELRAQGKLEAALQRAVAAESLCDPFVDEQRSVQLEILIELGDDEQIQVLARKLVESPGTAKSLADKARDLLAQPIRSLTRADLSAADDLRARNEIDAAREAYAQAVDAHPRDPVALSALGEIELTHSRPTARKLFERAVRAAGRHAQITVFSPSIAHGPVLEGTSPPSLDPVGLLQRISPSGGAFASQIVGPSTAFSKDQVLIYGKGHPLYLVTPEGREPREITVGNIKDIAFPPGEAQALAAVRTTEGLRVLDLAGGALRPGAPTQVGKGDSDEALRFASPTRLFVGSQLFRFPELTQVCALQAPVAPADVEKGTFTSADDIQTHAAVFTQIEHRWAPKGRVRVLLVRRTDDCSVVTEKPLGDDSDTPPLVSIHPSGKYVGWLGSITANVMSQGSLLEVASGKVTPFSYRGIYKVAPAALRITSDGTSACIFDGVWTPSRKAFGKQTHCWVHGGEARIVDVPKTVGFEDQSEGSLSQDGKQAVFAEREDMAKKSFGVAFRVLDVATGKTVNRTVVGKTSQWQPDAVFVSYGVVRVDMGTSTTLYFDATNGAKVEAPPDAKDPDKGVLDAEALTYSQPISRARSRLTSEGGKLAIQVASAGTGPSSSKITSCWSSDLHKLSVDQCDAKTKNNVEVKGNVATIQNVKLPVYLTTPLKNTQGATITLGKSELLALNDTGWVRYYARSGTLVGTVVALGPERLAALLPDGTVELIGDDARLTEQLFCTVGEVVLPIEACEDRTPTAGEFLKKVEAASR